jgi:phage FluMu protein Com
VNITVQRTGPEGHVELICPECRTANSIEERDVASRINELTKAAFDQRGGLQLHFGCGDGQWDHDTYRCWACGAENLQFPERLTVVADYA